MAQFSQIQEVEVAYENFDTEQGLPSSETYSMLEDNEGYLWFSTDRGIVRYNGVGMQFFGLNEGLSNLVNFNLVASSNGGFLVDDLNGQIHRWEDTVFVPFKHNEIL
ncbi:MAG: hypothetical protein JKY48_12730, partial [Flavobacteriales bacterium]|nr:hypothetical protein [Flavobacteriales bacterium]